MSDNASASDVKRAAREHVEGLVDAGHDEYRVFGVLESPGLPAQDLEAARRAAARVVGTSFGRDLNTGRGLPRAVEALLAACPEAPAWVFGQWAECVELAAADPKAAARVATEFSTLVHPGAVRHKEAYAAFLKVLVENHLGEAFDIIGPVRAGLDERGPDEEYAEYLRFVTTYADMFAVKSLKLLVPMFEVFFASMDKGFRDEFLARFCFDNLLGDRQAEKAVMGMAKTRGRLDPSLAPAFLRLAFTVARASFGSASHVAGRAGLDKKVARIQENLRLAYLERFTDIVANAGIGLINHCLSRMADAYAREGARADNRYTVAAELAREYGGHAARTWLGI
ncbi:MAG: hypothetical protein ACLFOY_07260 [Desulfatibacillaceae bacterium]